MMLGSAMRVQADTAEHVHQGIHGEQVDLAGAQLIRG
jgi:hypothetical protein